MYKISESTHNYLISNNLLKANLELVKKKKLKKDFQVGQDTEGEIMAAEGLEKGGMGSGRKKEFKWSATGWHEGHQYAVGPHPETGKTTFGIWNKEKDDYVYHHDLDQHPEIKKKAMDTGNTPGKETPIGPSGKPESIEQATAKNKIKKAEDIEKGGVGSGRKRIFVHKNGQEIHLTTKNNRQHFVTHSTDPSYSNEDELNNVQELRNRGYSEKEEKKDPKLSDLSNYKPIKKAEEKVEMPKQEFSSEHERLLHILEHGTAEERKKEADKQRKEVEKRLSKANGVDIIAPQTKDDKEGDYANVIVKDKEGRILLLKRASDKVEGGKWGLPGGHINDEEASSFAAARELKEESNLAVDPDQLIWIGKIMCQDGKWANYFGANDYIINNTSHAKQGVLALLDGEAVDAKYMTKEQWMSADLIYDLKDHLRDMLPAINAMVSQARVIQQIA